MSKVKIEIRKPQYLATKETSAVANEKIGEKKSPFLFRLLQLSTYVLSGLALWYAYQKFSAHS